VTERIVLFLVTGALFGLLTYSRRHLFSEGVSKPVPGKAGGFMEGRLLWTMVCSALWPLMALTGLFNAWARRGGSGR
jgi:hypothetical protein